MEGGSGKVVEDGTDEKLVQEEVKASDASKEQNEVKYSVNDIQNGETKMDCDMRRAFVGMGKEELMKFANDPFWVLTRKLLFALFWIMWIAMLVGSIAIVIYSPKCTGAKKPWFKDSVVYKFDIKSFEHGSLHNRIGDLKSFKDHLHYFEYLGVDTVLINSLMEATDSDRYAVKDFKKIDSSYGSFEILKDLTSKMKKKDIHLVMALDPNFSSDKHEWFRNSIAKIDPYTNYYVWTDGSFSSDDNKPLPPNNWVSVSGGSAWSYVKERNQFYLHQFSSHRPDFNYREQKVVDYMKDVYIYWLNQGISGLHLNNAEYLVEDMELKNESISPYPGATHEEYDFYSHTHTTNNPLTYDIIKDWAKSIENLGSVLSVSGFKSDNFDSSMIIYHTMKLNRYINATEFHKSVKNNLGRSNPTWQWECTSECPDEETSKALVSIFVLLPGISVIKGGEELPWPSPSGSWSSQVNDGALVNEFDYYINTTEKEKLNADSYLNSLKKLIELRKKDAFRYGSTEHHVLNSTVFAFTRSFSDCGYLIVFNFDDNERTITFNPFSDIKSDTKLTVLHVSKKSETALEVTAEEESDTLSLAHTLGGKTLAVFSFPIATSIISS